MEIVQTLHVKFFSFDPVEPVGSVNVKIHAMNFTVLIMVPEILFDRLR